MRKLLLILMMVSFAGVNTTNAAYFVVGHGVSSCGTVMSDLKEYPLMLDNYQVWMQGYISGLNAPDSRKGQNNDYKAIWYAVMNQCQVKPLWMLADATFWVYTYELTE